MAAPALSLEPRTIVRGYCLVLGIGLMAEGALLLVVQGSRGDVLHNLIHVAWGVAMLVAVLTDTSLRRASLTALVFGVFYTALALAGLVTHDPFGLQLGPGENAFHVIVGPLALALGVWGITRSPLGSSRRRQSPPAAPARSR